MDLDLEINNDFVDADLPILNMKPYFKYYNNCDHVNELETEKGDPVEIIRVACEQFKFCVTSAINKFDHHQRWNYKEKRGKKPTHYEAPSVNTLNECQDKCIQSNKNCMMFRFTDEKRCYLYNFNRNENNTKLFQEVNKNSRVDTFLRTDVYEKIDYKIMKGVGSRRNWTNSSSVQMSDFFDFNEFSSNARRKEIGNILFLSFLFILFKILN
jgi:hypothetical protein